jgi:hypothetical protein
MQAIRCIKTSSLHARDPFTGTVAIECGHVSLPIFQKGSLVSIENEFVVQFITKSSNHVYIFFFLIAPYVNLFHHAGRIRGTPYFGINLLWVPHPS